MSEQLDLDKISRVIALVGSAHDGEAMSAARAADRMLRSAGMQWRDFIDPYRQCEIATEAARQLLTENNELRAENERLRAENGRSTAIAVWQEVGAPIGNTHATAQWALGLHRDGELWLTDFEVGFLQTCAGWTGRLTARQAPTFRNLIDRIVDRTGLTPPT